MRCVSSEGGQVDHHEDLALVLGIREANVAQLLDVLAVVVIKASGVLSLRHAVLVFICRHFAAQAIGLWFSGSLKWIMFYNLNPRYKFKDGFWFWMHSYLYINRCICFIHRCSCFIHGSINFICDLTNTQGWIYNCKMLT